ncbi:MAG: glycoside hydrolase family 127 protein [Bacteroidales bacterium]|nr:glycoside hydrolase family 127 protein [Bacteroidales bacterium]
MKFPIFMVALSILILCGCARNTQEIPQITMNYPVKGISFNKVHINDSFWLPKIETNRVATIPASFKKCEEMGRLESFLIAGGKMAGQVRGKMPFDDTDVYKIIEGASYSMSTIPDAKLDAYVDSLIAIIACAQEEDGYLTTYKTIDTAYAPAPWCPPGKRWEHLGCSHELYNSGHMFEAAAAHYLATGKRNFLDIATKNADLLVKVFLHEKTNQVPGHQIVETGLIKLYLITGKKDYLDLARHFLDIRGDSTIRGESWGPYSQDHMPVTQQEEAVGHAVRAAYMYAGMTDIAALYNDSAYREAVDKIWDNVVSKKIYITGGIGALHQGEAFGDNYELPNLTAYNETCAAIANVYWNYRMFLLHGEAKYIDVLERSLYNGVISGVSLDGKTFFYPNPLECDMHYKFNSGETLTRQPWFDCSCCPSNLCRFMPSVPGYIYAQTDTSIFINLFIQSSTEMTLNGVSVATKQETNYPWDGKIKIHISSKEISHFTLQLRVPGWAVNLPLPGNLYTFTDFNKVKPVVKVNGVEYNYQQEDGYAIVSGDWNPGDIVEYELPMYVREVEANMNVKADSGLIALVRGPIVYCLEEKDNPKFDEVLFSNDLVLNSKYNPDLLNGIEVITAKTPDGNPVFTAIPYYVWNNRGANKMRVWLPEI